jgi:TatD DNase family protein
MNLIDTHCHLTGLQEVELNQLLSNARTKNVNRFICIGASKGIESASQAVAIAEADKDVFASVGVHPHDAGSYTDLSAIEHLIASHRVVAIGETGLDFFRDWAPRENQFELFKNTILIAKKYQKRLIIHCRDAREETYRMLVEHDAGSVGGVFHCYSEDAQFAAKLREINFLVSFTGNITFKKAEAIRDTVKNIPLEQMMLETDCPYMAPEPFRGKPSEPMHVYNVAEMIAKVKGVSLEEVAARTTLTAENFFNLLSINPSV